MSSWDIKRFPQCVFMIYVYITYSYTGVYDVHMHWNDNLLETMYFT